MVCAVVCQRRESGSPNTTTRSAPGTRWWVALRSWVWPTVYLLCGGAVVIALALEPKGYSAILQILGTLITVVSFWATIMIRTSKDPTSKPWEKPLLWMTAVGGMLIATGIYSGAIDDFDAGWHVGLGTSIIAGWFIIIVLAGRTIK